MDFILDAINEWITTLLVDGIMGNLTGLFDNINSEVSRIAGDVGKTPSQWNGGVFSMIENLSDTVIMPIAGIILTFVMCYELIQMVIDRNNMHEFPPSDIFKWMMKTFIAVVLVTNTFPIMMGIFDVAQSVISNAAGVIITDTAVGVETLEALRESLLQMDIGSLLGLYLQSFLMGIIMWALTVCIFIIVYGRMLEIYLMTSLGAIPIFQSDSEALYYGLNALSSNLIMVDRKQLKNPNGLILGTPGSGKSFAAKREITNVFLITTDDIIVCDPEGEYFSIVQRLKGQVIKISPTSSQYINPMDINLNYSEDDSPLALKSDFILSLCELIVGGKEGLTPVEKSIIDRCVTLVYAEYLAAPNPAKMPILGDLYDALGRQEEKEAKHIRSALEIYVTGSLSVFNHRTNVDITNRIVCYDIKELGKQLKKLGMLIVQDQVWNRVTINRAEKRSTRYYMDEFHLLLKEEQTAAYSVEIWKRFRKWGGIPTAITQNIKDLLSSREVENIFENSDFVYMLNQAAGDRAILAKQLNISPHQLSYVTGSGVGEGLLFYGNVILPFVDKFPTNTELYSIMTTKLIETKQE